MRRGRPTDASAAGRRARADVGATLPELLLVLVVLGALAAATVLAVARLRSDATAVACDADRSALERAASLWMRDDDTVPTPADLVDAGLVRSAPDSFDLDDRGRVVPDPAGPCRGYRSTDEVAGGEHRSGPPAGGESPGGGASPAGSPGGGESPTGSPVDDMVEVSLAWTGNADLDVWVRTPDGSVVGWTGPGPGGGQLDLDVVPSAPDAVGPHVERIVWPSGSAPGGDYVAWADFRTAGWGDQPAASFVLSVRRGDDVLASLDGPIGPPGSSSAELPATIT